MSTISDLKDKDVIGAGIDYYSKKIFFTKNGKILSSHFININIDNYYPTFGIKGYGCCLKFNFGKEKFIYNLDEKIKILNKLIHSEIYELNQEINSEIIEENENDNINKDEIISNIIINYFFNNGYKNTFNKFLKEIDFQGDLKEICSMNKNILNNFNNNDRKTRGESIFIENDDNNIQKTDEITIIINFLNSIYLNIKNGDSKKLIEIIQTNFPLLLHNNELMNPIIFQIFLEKLNKNYYNSILNLPQVLNNQLVFIYDEQKGYIEFVFNDLISNLLIDNKELLKNILLIEQRLLSIKIITKIILNINGYDKKSSLEKLIFHLNYLKERFIKTKPEISELFNLLLNFN